MTSSALVGALIRSRRLEKNFSQEGLCRGICAVSYLSKIEKGLVTPSDDILKRLFSALSLSYCCDERVLAPLRLALDACFDAFFLHQEISSLAAPLLQARETLLYSSLHVHYRLFEVLHACYRGDNPAAYALAQPLLSYRTCLNAREHVFLCLLLARCSPDAGDALSFLTHAEALLPSAVTALELSQHHFCQGRYQEALSFAHTAYARAAATACIPAMQCAAFIQGTCYSNLYEYALMLASYRRVRALCEPDARILHQVDYNTGASYLIKGEPQNALPYLSRALEAFERLCVPEDTFLTLHKLAVCFQLTGRREEGLSCLRRAQDVLSGASTLPAVYADMLRLVSLRFEPGFLRNREYLSLAHTLYRSVGACTHHGFTQFHALLYIQALCANRQYKQALHIALDTRIVFPQSFLNKAL